MSFAISSFDEIVESIEESYTQTALVRCHQVSCIGIITKHSWRYDPATARGVTSGTESTGNSVTSSASPFNKNTWGLGFSVVSSWRTLISRGANSLWAPKLSTLPMNYQSAIPAFRNLDDSSTTNFTVRSGKNGFSCRVAGSKALSSALRSQFVNESTYWPTQKIC